MDRELVNDAIRTELAKQVLLTVKAEDRDALLEKSIKDAIESWSFQSEIAEAIAIEADKIAGEMIKKEHWQKEITMAVRKGMQKFTKQLEKAVYQMLIQDFSGEGGTYDYKGALFPFLHKNRGD